MHAEITWLRRVSQLAAVIAATAGLAGFVTAAPAAAGAITAPEITSCAGPPGSDFGTQYLSASWPGSFTGVPVYSNATAKYQSNCYNHATTPAGKTVESGMEWQCVELINRLYITKGWIDQRWAGDGDKLYYDPPVNPATGQHLTTQPQHSITALSPGDVISFSDSAVPGGHAAVVSEVNGTAITFVNQNTSRKNVLSYGHLSNGTLTMTGWKGYTPIGAIDAPPAPAWGKAIEVPGIAALNTGGDAVVTSVSCASSGNCSAGGVYQIADANEDQHAFVISEVNGTWGTAQKVSGTAAAGGITSISCASAGNCSAGGYSNSQRAFVVSEVNGAWGKAIGVPGAAAPGISASWLQSMSCGSPGNCSAGGSYQKGGATNEAFVVSQTGGTWGHLTEVPGTAALNTGGYAEINSVSCVSAGNCSAGGDYQGAGGDQAFVASQSGGSWGKAIEVPGTAALNTSGYATVTSVSCASAGNCGAGGLYSTGASQDVFVVSQVNGTWHTAIKVHGILSGADWLRSVSCGSPGNCSAGGYYADGAVTEPFVINETDGTWGTATNVPGGTYDKVTTISCASAGNCSAGGASTGGQAFVVNETYGTWDTATGVRGLGAGGSALYSVSCPAVGNCAAGGAYTSSGKTQAFVVAQS
jgi:hypothetical protein